MAMSGGELFISEMSQKECKCAPFYRIPEMFFGFEEGTWRDPQPSPVLAPSWQMFVRGFGGKGSDGALSTSRSRWYPVARSGRLTPDLLHWGLEHIGRCWLRLVKCDFGVHRVPHEPLWAAQGGRNIHAHEGSPTIPLWLRKSGGPRMLGASGGYSIPPR